MKNSVILSILSFGFLFLGYSQPTTYNVFFDNEEISGTTFCVDLLISFDDVANLGSSNIVFNFSDGLANPTYFSDNLSDLPSYFDPTVSNPRFGVASFNIELAIAGFGDPMNVEPARSLIGRVCFDIIDEDIPIDLAFIEDQFSQTIIFIDDEFTFLAPGTLGTLSITCLKTGNSCDDGNACTINDVYDDDCNCVGTPQFPDTGLTVSSSDASCGLDNGTITFDFTPVTDPPNIEFSIDGQTSWPAAYNVPSNSGSLTIQDLAPGTYDLWVRWGNDDCPRDLGSVTITGSPNIVAFAGDDQTICAGESATLSATGGGPTATYTWDNGLGQGQTKTVNPSATTTYTVTISDGNGCEDSDAVTVTVDDPETPNATPTGTPCGENTGSILFTYTTDPGDMEYSVDGGNTFLTLSRISLTSFEIDNQGAGIINVELKGIGSNCIVSINNIEIVNTNIGASCDDGNDCTINDVYDADCNCVGTPQFPDDGLSVTATDATCGLDNGSITFDFTPVNNPPNIEFSIDGQTSWPAAYNVASSSGSFTIQDLEPGTYDLWVRWGNDDCPRDLGSVTIAGLPNIVASAGNDQTICEGESVTLTATGGGPTATYTWDNGLGDGASHTVSPVPANFQNESFTYTVTVEDNGCIDTDEVVINVRSIPVVTSISKTDLGCGGPEGSITFKFLDHPNRSHIEFSIDGGNTWPSAYYLQDNSDSLRISNLAAGSYDLWVRWGNNECPIDLQDVTINNFPELIASAGQDVTLCVGESTDLLASYTGGGPTATYTWDNGLGEGQTHTVTPGVTTTYTVTIIDENGCEDTDDVTITIDDPETPSLTINDTPCGEETGSILFTYSADPGDMEYSLDGGTTFLGLTRNGPTTFELNDLGIGTLDIQLQAVGSNCPISVGTIEIEGSTIGEACDDGNPLTVNDVYNSNCECVGTGGARLQLFVLLQGAYDANGNMLDGLRSSGNITTTDPYGLGATTAASTFGDFGLNSVVDWIEVQLRDANDPSVIVGRTAVLVRRNGYVVSPVDGNLTISIPGVVAGSYYVAIDHYNHFSIMTAQAIDLTTEQTIDFTLSSTPIYRYDEGSTARVDDFEAMIAGDANRDGTVNAVDKNFFWKPENGQPYQYGTSKSDFNLDGAINAVDKNDYWQVNNSKVELVP